MTPIRQGDGTGVTPTGISEVRTGDGRVVYTPGPAIPDSVVDDFEADLYEDQSNTLSDYYERDVGDFSRQQSVVLQGDYALTTSALKSRIFSTSGLPRYPSQDTPFRVNFRYGLGDARDIYITYFAVQSGSVDLPDSYRLKIDTDAPGSGASAVLERVTNGSASSLDADSAVDVTLLDDEWLEWQIDWQSSGDISVTLVDSNGTEQGSLSAKDSDYTSGGIGFQLFSESTTTPDVFWDNYRTL